MLAAAGLTVVDVEELSTHGGSLRTWSAPDRARSRALACVARVLAAEAAAGLDTVEGHAGFAAQVATVRNDLVEFLIGCARRGETVVAYGAPGKGNTLLNHCGIRSDLMRVHRRPEPVQARHVPAWHAHPDPPRGGAGGGSARLRADHAVEPPRGDLRTARGSFGSGAVDSSSRCRTSRSSRKAHLAQGGSSMKVVLFCGGLGMRMRSGPESLPKPMMPIGSRPVLWHVMRYYAHFGHTEFILCLGFGAHSVKDYFLNYQRDGVERLRPHQGR